MTIPTFAAWLRVPPSRAWRLVVHGSEAACRAALAEATAGLRSCDTYVGTSDPNRRQHVADGAGGTSDK